MMSDLSATWHRPEVSGLERIHSGKVRESYAIDEQYMLIVASDRISAFDVILPDPIPDKGCILTALSNFWFATTQKIVSNHLSDLDLETIITDPYERALLASRSVIVKRLRPLPVEAIVRGYLIGSAWEAYQGTGSVCGQALPSGLQQAQSLPTAIFTPSTKADLGEHDKAIDLVEMSHLIGEKLTQQIKTISLRLYSQAASYALQRGIIIADTKFEFGLDDKDQLVLMDELLTPDSSRFWPIDQYTPGISPPSLDKQYIRDYLETLDWDKTPPGPRLSKQVILETARKYHQARQILSLST